MNEKLLAIKAWLGAGSVNIFGLPMSGKDTVGARLAEELGAKFLSSGMMLREVERETGQNLTSGGKLAPTEIFYQVVLPYFARREIAGQPLVLSSVGRWSGEEVEVMRAAKEAGHEIKAAVWLKVSEAEVIKRWEAVGVLNDRGGREDDKDLAIFQTRIAEFNEKTVPVLRKYGELGKLVAVKADMVRDEVFSAVVDELYKFSKIG